MTCDGESCNTFKMESDTHTIALTKPFYNSIDNRTNKDIDRFSFEMGGYDVVDKGIEGQPLILKGIEKVPESEKDIACFSCGGLCFTFCFAQTGVWVLKFQYILEIANNNEEVTISGLGDCIDAVYIIKGFRYETVSYWARSWTLVLEKVRD